MSEPASLDVAAMVDGVRRADRAALARAISLVESTSPRHLCDADELLRALAPNAGEAARSIRVGITGVPGAGKSTFIETLGLRLCGTGRRVAVLAIDPSSTVSGGSILGDRTRMAKLGADPRAYIRPSPSGGTLGGVARRTRETAALCEAAGFDVVLIETVGVGQSETLVADMTDCVLALALPGSGDELQGVKRGLLEVVDVIAVNKADGDNIDRARRAAAELTASIRVLRGSRDSVPVVLCSAVAGTGIDEVWEAVESRMTQDRTSGRFESRRAAQRERWMEEIVEERLRALLLNAEAVTSEARSAGQSVREGTIAPGEGAARIVRAFLREARGLSDPQV